MANADGSAVTIDISSDDIVNWKDRPESQLQIEAYNSVVEHIKNLRQLFEKVGTERSISGDDHDESPLRPRYHNAITIVGGRGSGKTTFVLNLLQRIKNATPKEEGGAFGGLEVLPHIDPSIVENKESILVSIIAMIERRCDDHWRKYAKDESIAGLRKVFINVLERLARGLKSLDGIGSERPLGSHWDDPKHILNEGLDDARAGLDLEKNFHALIDAALKMLNKKAFVLAFDDIDTRFNRGWPVLEVLRKFLTSPRLVIVVTGDLALYRLLIRREQYRNLGSELLKYDRPLAEHHRKSDLTSWQEDRLVKQVDSLEDQYLRKILPASLRVELVTVWDLIKRGKTIDVRRSITEPITSQSLSGFLDAIVKEAHGSTNPDMRGSFRRALLSQPVRTIVQFLRISHKFLGLSQGSESKKTENLADYNRSYASFAHSSYATAGVKTEAIISGQFWSFCAELIRWAQKNDDWLGFSRLIPASEDHDQNNVTVGFSSGIQVFTRATPQYIFEYMLRIGLPRELMSIRGRILPSQILATLGINSSENAMQLGRRAITAHFNFLDTLKPSRGCFFVPIERYSVQRAAFLLWGVSKDEYNKKSVDTVDLLSRRAEEIFAEVSTTESPIGGWWIGAKSLKDYYTKDVYGVFYNSVLSIYGRFDWGPAIGWVSAILESSRGAKTGAISVYPLIGLLAECLAIPKDQGRANRPEMIRALLRKGAQLRSFPSGWAGSQEDEMVAPDLDDDESTGQAVRQRLTEIESTQDGSNTEPHRKFLDAVSMVVSAWAEVHQSANLSVNPQLMHRIFVRFYYTLTRIDAEVSSDLRAAGFLLHRQIVAFLNAVLVEEQMERGQSDSEGSSATAKKLRLDNPSNSDTIFRANLEALGMDTENVGVDFQKAPLFALVWSFPLWGLFLAPKTTVYAGNKPEVFKIGEMQRITWKYGSDETTIAKRMVLEKTTYIGSFRKSTNPPPSFESLWAPLNSIPVFRPGTQPTKIERPKTRGRPKKGNKDKPPENSTAP